MTPLLWCTLAAVVLVGGAVADIVLAAAIALSALLAAVAQLFSEDWQIATTVFCFTAMTGTWLAVRWRQKRPVRRPVMDDDIGQPVTLLRNNPDGSLRVHYRGSDWDARWQDQAPSALPETGSVLVICGKQANFLCVCAKGE